MSENSTRRLPLRLVKKLRLSHSEACHRTAPFDVDAPRLRKNVHNDMSAASPCRDLSGASCRFLPKLLNMLGPRA